MQKTGILAQPVIERLKQHRWIFGGVGLLAALGMAAAIAVAPGDDATALRVQTITESLVTESAKPLNLDAAVFLHEERIQRGDTVGSLLARLGIDDPEAIQFIRNHPGTQAIHRQLAPGKTVVSQTTAGGELRQLIFPLNGGDTALLVERRDQKLLASEQALRFETQTLMKTAEIRYSLFGATDASEIPDGVATQLAEIFGGDIDFHRDLRQGDRFSVIYEMHYLRGQPARSGRILAAEFINNGRTLRAIYFEQNGKGGYYAPDGKSLRKAFLRSPLEFSRISSGFSMRLHPILKEWRAHKGIDYAAPTGTRVRATSDGTVDFIGRRGGYGNLIILRHAGAHSTAYGHLNGFAPGLKRGSRVSQGEVIGYVGATGWATGPHLHYEFRVNNQQVNPLAIVLPTAPALDAAQMPLFRANARDRLELITLTHVAPVAALD